MVQKYISKYNKIYHQLNCPKSINVIINDQLAWATYKPYRHLYNKMFIAQYQHLYHAPMPIEPLPQHYPIVIKPIINLYSMGLNSHTVNNRKQFHQLWEHTGFWTEYLTGTHYCFDLIIYHGVIQWHTCFIGHYLYLNHTKVHGTFDYWESKHHQTLPPIVRQLVSTELIDYTGCLNVECIGDHIIECHLRMGDIDHFTHPHILKGIIQIYHHQTWPYPDLIPDPIYLFTIWGKHPIKKHHLKRKIHHISHQYHLHCYQIDDGHRANPGQGKLTRLANLTSPSYQNGRRAQRKIYQLLQTHHHL